MAKSIYASIDHPHIWFLTKDNIRYYLNWIYINEVDYSIGYFCSNGHRQKSLYHLELEKNMFVTEKETFFDFVQDHKQSKVFSNKNRIYGIVPVVLSYDKEYKIYHKAI